MRPKSAANCGMELTECEDHIANWGERMPHSAEWCVAFVRLTSGTIVCMNCLRLRQHATRSGHTNRPS